MLIGLHHVGRVVTDLDTAADELRTVTGWQVTVRPADDDPLVAGRSVTRTATGRGPNGWIELVEVPGPAAPRREVNEPGITHAGIQVGRIERVLERLHAAGIGHHPGPVDLGTGYAYLYVRDGEALVTEVEGAPHAPADLDAWLVHGAIATADLPRLRAAYEALLDTPATRTVRLRGHGELDRVSALHDVDVTGTWVPGANASVEIWQFHHPPTVGDPMTAYEAPGGGHLAFETDDVAADVERAVAAGFSVADPCTAVDGVELARLRDPDGNWVELMRFVEPSDPRSLRAARDLDRARRMDELVTRSGR